MLGETLHHVLQERPTCRCRLKRSRTSLLIRADKNPNAAAAGALFAPLAEGVQGFDDATDLVLIWGEGFDFARLPPRARTIFLNAYLQPENAQSDVFIPVSIQTERRGHYTNFQGIVSAFEPCFPKRRGSPMPRRCSPRWAERVEIDA